MIVEPRETIKSCHDGRLNRRFLLYRSTNETKQSNGHNQR